jgi:hypothetical protein
MMRLVAAPTSAQRCDNQSWLIPCSLQPPRGRLCRAIRLVVKRGGETAHDTQIRRKIDILRDGCVLVQQWGNAAAARFSLVRTIAAGAEAERQWHPRMQGPHYLATIGAHCEAAKRRVSVTRIYYFKNREFFDPSKMREHLSALKNAGIDIQVTFLSEVTLEPDYDFLVFGGRKVSVGVIDPATGKVWSARASIIPRDVNAYIEKYQRLKELSQPIDKVN